MAESIEFEELAAAGYFKKDPVADGLWKIAPGARVVVSHNSRDIELTGFKDGKAVEDRHSVQHLNARKEITRYVPMRYVWIDPDQIFLPDHLKKGEPQPT